MIPPSMYPFSFLTLYCADQHEEVRWCADGPAQRFCWFCGAEGKAGNNVIASDYYPFLHP